MKSFWKLQKTVKIFHLWFDSILVEKVRWLEHELSWSLGRPQRGRADLRVLMTSERTEKGAGRVGQENEQLVGPAMSSIDRGHVRRCSPAPQIQIIYLQLMLSNKRHHVLFMQLITVSVKQKLCCSTISCKEQHTGRMPRRKHATTHVQVTWWLRLWTFFLSWFRIGYRYA